MNNKNNGSNTIMSNISESDSGDKRRQQGIGDMYS